VLLVRDFKCKERIKIKGSGLFKTRALCREGSLDKAAFIEFAHDAIVDHVFDFNFAKVASIFMSWPAATAGNTAAPAVRPI
jgi:hypothetical protein